MSERTIKLTGGRAIVVLVALVGFAGYRMVSARSSLSTDGAAELQMWLRGEYASRYLQRIEGENLTAAAAQPLLDLDQVTIRSIRGRGTPDEMIVRAEIEVAGHAPPDGRAVRYWRMQYSSLTGWRMQREVWAFSYYLKVF